MSWQILIAMIVAVPIILLPVAVLWYLDVGGVINRVKNRFSARERKA
jgi:hypothetical protein